MRQCSLENCNRKYATKGYCDLHYRRLLYRGDVNYIYKRTKLGNGVPEVVVWRSMLARCNNPNNASYPHYGGRGIKVCSRWRNSFDNFIADMGSRPSNKYSIDRINNDGDYEPSNCKWSTVHEQMSNRRNSNEVAGVYFLKKYKKWEASFKMDGEIKYRKQFDTREEAIKMRREVEVKYLGDIIKSSK